MNAHAVLGVASNATPEQIKSAYRKLAMQHHPDRNGGSEESANKFQEIQTAYDMLRQDKPQQQQQQQNYQQHSPQDAHVHDIFEQFFRQHHMGNPSLTAHATITLEQAFHGCTVSFEINGNTVAVAIPAGADHGQLIRVAGAAGSQNPNFPAGDLNVVVIMHPHDRFRRHGMTLVTSQKIDLLDLLTGSEAEVETITGEKVRVKVPENSSPETVIVISGQGMSVVNSDQRGDLMLHFEVVYPKFDTKQLATLRKMKK